MVTQRQPGIIARAGLLEAAAIEFWERGLEATRIHDVLVRAKLGKGSGYYHFKTKTLMAEALMAEYAGVWAEQIERVTASPQRGLAAAGTLSREIVRAIVTDPCARVTLRLAHELDETMPRDGQLHVWRAAFGYFLQQAIVDGDIPEAVPVHAVAQVLVSGITGVALVALSTENGSWEQELDVLWSCMLDGMRSITSAPNSSFPVRI